MAQRVFELLCSLPNKRFLHAFEMADLVNVQSQSRVESGELCLEVRFHLCSKVQVSKY